MHHLDQPIDDYVIPRISMDYRSSFSWKPNGDLSDDELQKLREIISTVHARGKKIRFWGHPQTEAFWNLLTREGVDWINVDNLNMYNAFSAKATVKEN